LGDDHGDRRSVTAPRRDTRLARARGLRRWRALLLVVVSMAMLPAATPAFGYVRYLSKKGKPYFWSPSCVRLEVFPIGLSDMTPEQIANAASEAARQWTVGNSDLTACTYFDIPVTVAAATAQRPIAKYDKRNFVIFRGDTWCPEGSDTAACYEPAALALTSVWAADGTGEIVDADVQVNAVNFAWADLDVASDPRRQDLQNALTHEMGHFIGLDHTCFQPGTVDTVPVDQNGDPIPSCDTASALVRATTMFASAAPGDTQKRTLESDDRQAICDIYPIAKDPMSCPAPGGGTGCQCAIDVGSPVTGRRGSWAAPIAVTTLAGLWLGLARRRARRRR